MMEFEELKAIVEKMSFADLEWVAEESNENPNSDTAWEIWLSDDSMNVATCESKSANNKANAEGIAALKNHAIQLLEAERAKTARLEAEILRVGTEGVGGYCHFCDAFDHKPDCIVAAIKEQMGGQP